jgi:hypothetical protein
VVSRCHDEVVSVPLPSNKYKKSYGVQQKLDIEIVCFSGKSLEIIIFGKTKNSKKKSELSEQFRSRKDTESEETHFFSFFREFENLSTSMDPNPEDLELSGIRE